MALIIWNTSKYKNYCLDDPVALKTTKTNKTMSTYSLDTKVKIYGRLICKKYNKSMGSELLLICWEVKTTEVEVVSYHTKLTLLKHRLSNS